MKQCAYCGQENAAELAFCQECGTELGDRTVEREVRGAHDLAWFKNAVAYASMIVAAACLYLLSLGPVSYYWATRTPVVPAVTSPTGVTMVQTITYPAWVGVVYYPAFSVLSLDSLGRVYAEYLGWWESR